MVSKQFYFCLYLLFMHVNSTIMELTLISLLIASVYSQAPICSSGNNLPAFSACVRDSLTDPSGQIGPIDISSACTSYQNDQGAYFNCLCAKASAVVNCFSIFCPGDPVASSAKQSQTQFCDAAKLYPTSTTAAKTPTQASATASSTSSTTSAEKPNQNSGSIIQIVPAIITFVIGLMI